MNVQLGDLNVDSGWEVMRKVKTKIGNQSLRENTSNVNGVINSEVTTPGSLITMSGMYTQ